MIIQERHIERFRHAGKDSKPCDECFGKGYVYSYAAKVINNGIPVFRRCKYCDGNGVLTLTDSEVQEILQDEYDSAREDERD